MKLDLEGRIMTGSRYNEAVDWLLAREGHIVVAGENYKGRYACATQESLAGTRVATHLLERTLQLTKTHLIGTDEMLCEFRMRFL